MLEFIWFIVGAALCAAALHFLGWLNVAKPTEQKPNALPWLKNAHFALVLAVAFPVSVILIEGLTGIEIPSEVWTLVGAASIKLFDIANRVLDLYAERRQSGDPPT